MEWVRESSANAVCPDLLRLALLPGIGPRHLTRLLDALGSARAVLQASEAMLCEVDGIGKQLARKILNADLHINPDEVQSHCAERGIDILMQNDARYPRPLRSLPDAPPVLFAWGQWLRQDELSIGIVGTRHATHYGKTQAQKIAAALGRRGITVISGLARGIDRAAHEGALEGNGRTVAVLGCGHDHLYPPEHENLAKAVAADGAIVSELPPWTKPRGPMFPQRNRLISGLSLGVLVIEAADRSGSLITARHAMEQGREVFALPGSVASRVSRGCHALIRDGATLIENAEQLIDALGPLAEAIPREGADDALHHPAELNLNDQERLVLNAIGTEPTAIDAVTARTGLPIHRVLSTLSVLEMRHLIRRLSGQFVSRR